jgi:hypothetical protein
MGRSGILDQALGLTPPPTFGDSIDPDLKYVVKMAPKEYWDTFEDYDKMGIVPVLFGGRIYRAIPLSKNFRPITKEFAKKYRDTLGVVIQFVDGDLAKMVWTDFIFWKDKIPFGVLEDYPYRDILLFDEKLVILRDKKNDKISILFNPFDSDGNFTGSARGFTIDIDNTKDSERVRIDFDKDSRKGHTVVLNNEKDSENIQVVFRGSGKEVEFLMDKDGVKVTTEDSVVVNAGDKVDIVSPKINLGSLDSAAQPVVLGDNLVDVLEFIMDVLLNHIHPTATGPSGPLMPPYSGQIPVEKQNLPEILSNKSRTD